MNRFQEAMDKIICGTTNCDGCGAPAPTATGLCEECRRDMRDHKLRHYIEDRITEWERPIEELKQQAADLDVKAENIREEIRRRELVAGELRKALQASTLNAEIDGLREEIRKAEAAK